MTNSDRLRTLIRELKETQSSFAERIDTSQSTIANAIMRGSKLNSDIIGRIIKAYPLVNISWLLSGEGDMFKKAESLESTIRGRLALLTKHADIGVSEISKSLNIDEKYVKRYVNGDSTPDLGFIKKFAEAYPQVSLNWLLTGEGTMFKSDKVEVEHKDGKFYFNFPTEDRLPPGILLKLFLEEKGISKSEFARRMNISLEQVDDHLGLKDYNMDYLLEWAKALDTKTTELFMSADMYLKYLDRELKSETLDNKITSSIPLTHEEAPFGVNESKINIRPHIESTVAACGSPNGFNKAIMEHECEAISLPFMVSYDFSIRASGDSMINRENPKRSIANRDIIACRYWTSRTHVRWGEVYALATMDGVIIKKIVPADKEGSVKCVSFNEADGYVPYELALEEITDWAIVVGVVSVEPW